MAYFTASIYVGSCFFLGQFYEKGFAAFQNARGRLGERERTGAK